jgi:valyl-tRNA synthetase
MLGDTAVCVHPTDERYTDLIDKHVHDPGQRPYHSDRRGCLLADKTLGTGAVKVTPAHDPNDYACWSRNKDKMGEPINILNTDGTINENGGEYQGLDRYGSSQASRCKDGFARDIWKRSKTVIPMKYSDRQDAD